MFFLDPIWQQIIPTRWSVIWTLRWLSHSIVQFYYSFICFSFEFFLTFNYEAFFSNRYQVFFYRAPTTWKLKAYNKSCMYIQGLYKKYREMFRKNRFISNITTKPQNSSKLSIDTLSPVAFPRIEGSLVGGFRKVLKGTRASFFDGTQGPMVVSFEGRISVLGIEKILLGSNRDCEGVGELSRRRFVSALGQVWLGALSWCKFQFPPMAGLTRLTLLFSLLSTSK